MNINEKEDKNVCLCCNEPIEECNSMSFRDRAFKVAEQSFEQIWKQNKQSCKQMSKKELAREFFYYGTENVLTGLEMPMTSPSKKEPL
jgi:hypothetical protein